MKLLIASDIHGDAACTEELLKRFDEEGCEKLVLLGDILYHGPRNELPAGYAPKKVIELLNARKDCIIAVKGNCDAEVDQMVLNFPITSESAVLTDGDVTIFFTHGHKYNADNLPPLGKGEHLVHGHTHLITKETLPGGGKLLNPGSVSIPKNGHPKSYMIYEGGTAVWHALDGTYLFEEKLN